MNSGGPNLPPIRRRPDTTPAAGRAAQSGWAAASSSGWESVDGRSGSSGARLRSGPRSSPPRYLIASLGVVAATSLWMTLATAQFGRPGLTIGIALGMFGGVILLGWIRLNINGKRSASGRFADWRLPAVRVATALFGIGWLAGLLALWRFAIDLSRRFT